MSIQVKVTPDMVGRANALAPTLEYATVKAMLESALACLPLESCQLIRDQIVAEAMPEFFGGFVRYMRIRNYALVYHNGALEDRGPTSVAAEEALIQCAQSYSDQLGPDGVERLYRATIGSVFDISSGGLEAARRAC